MSEAWPRVFVLGAGPVATSLASSLRIAGVPVVGLWARRPDAVAAASGAAMVPGFSGVQPPRAEIAQAEILLLAVRDAAIAEVANQLAAGGFLAGAPVLLHCSGAVAAEVALAAAAPLAGGTGLLHPLRAMVPQVLVDSFEGTTFGVQGDEAGRAAAERLCLALKGRALALQAEQMPSYHAAAVMAANYLVTLLHAAESLAAQAGIDSGPMRLGLLDLAEGALAGVRRAGTVSALTGPIRRGDRATIEGHLSAIADHLPAATPMYSELGLWTLALARECGDAEDSELDEIYSVLSKSR